MKGRTTDSLTATMGWPISLPELAPSAGRQTTADVHAGTDFEGLVRAVAAHARAEAGSIDAYHRLAARIPDPLAALLLRVIVEDEERHHTLLPRIIATLQDDLDWSASPSALPATLTPAQAPAADLAALRAALQDEADSARRFHELAHEQGTLHDGVIGLLLETMARDSQKHQDILAFVLRRLESGT